MNVIQCAMPQEAAAFSDLAEEQEALPAPADLSALRLRIDGREFVLVTGGIGLANAALAATWACLTLTPSAIVSAGTSAGLAADLALHDVVVGTDCLFLDADASVAGWQLGQIPRMPARFSADLDGVAGVRSGLVVSGDRFMSPEAVALTLQRYPDALISDMESAAIALTCHRFGVPHQIVRSVSDRGDSAEFWDNLPPAAAASARASLQLLAA